MIDTYSSDDVSRWEKSCHESIDMHLSKLEQPLPERLVDFHLGMLSVEYHSQGMIYIVRKSFDEAIGSFRKSVDTLCRMYERFVGGQGRALEAGHFQSILIAYMTGDEFLISKLVRLYRADDGTPDSVFFGRVLTRVARGDLDGAKEELCHRVPRVDPQFAGYIKCFEAIAEKDQVEFVSALGVASGGWAKWATKWANGLPDSVCFVQGAGLVRLAERVMCHRIHVSNEHIPPELLA